MKDINFYFDEAAQKDYRKVIQDKSREELIDIAVDMSKRYWDAYDIAEKLYDEWWEAIQADIEAVDALKQRHAELERENRYLDEFSDYFGRQKKYPNEQE